MQKGRFLLGMSKHRKKGTPPAAAHFTGRKGGKQCSRKGKGLTRKQRRLKRGTHVNKYVL